MNAMPGYKPFVMSVLLMILVLLLIYPHYQYYVDPDGAAYLTIAKRYAEGDWEKAVNGYWSPWSCWLTALLIKTGLAPIPASIVINSVGACGFLYISQSFFLKFDINQNLQWILNVTLAFFLCYAIFWQSFDDLWECFFLLVTLRLILADGFQFRPLLWVMAGAVGALAYFAKAYAFPFFILNTVVCVYYLCRNDKALWLKVSGIIIGTMFLFALPWIWILHNKYGIWTTSTAGSLNTSWFLVGHPEYKSWLKGFLPPVYPDSPFYWEDPYAVNGDAAHFWDSWYLFGRQFLKIGYNIYKLLESMLQLSVLFPLISLVTWLMLTSKKMKEMLPGDISIVALSFVLFPLGYVFVNFESRYIWYMLPLGMLTGAMVLQQFSGKLWISIGCACLFLLYPVWQMRETYDTGKDDYLWAQEMKRHNVTGSFTAVVPAGKFMHSAERIAYFSGNSFYSLKPGQITETDLLAEMRQYGINYLYVYTYSGNNCAGILRKAVEGGSRIRETGIGETNEIKVFRLN